MVLRGRGAVEDTGMMGISRGRRGILPVRVPIAGVVFAAAACAVVSCGFGWDWCPCRAGRGQDTGDEVALRGSGCPAGE